MKKKLIFTLTLALIGLSGAFAQTSSISYPAKVVTSNTPCDTCFTQQIWMDDFESYPPNQFPAPTWAYTGNSDIYVDNTISQGGIQSLRLNGTIAGSWEAIACKSIPTPLNTLNGFLIEFYIRISSNHVQGVHPYTSYLALNTICDWQTWQGVDLVHFEYNGNIYGRLGVFLGTYVYDTWYKINIRYNRISTSTVNLSYWINDICAGDTSCTTAAYENNLTNIDFTSGDGTIWVDSFKFSDTLSCSTGIKEIAVDKMFFISPNPTTENFTITFANVINKGMIEICDVLGGKILSENILNESKKEIQLKNVCDGIYFVKLYDGERSFAKKIIIARD